MTPTDEPTIMNCFYCNADAPLGTQSCPSCGKVFDGVFTGKSTFADCLRTAEKDGADRFVLDMRRMDDEHGVVCMWVGDEDEPRWAGFVRLDGELLLEADRARLLEEMAREAGETE